MTDYVRNHKTKRILTMGVAVLMVFSLLVPMITDPSYWEDCFLLCYHDAPSVESAHDFFNYLAGKIRITLGDARTIK